MSDDISSDSMLGSRIWLTTSDASLYFSRSFAIFFALRFKFLIVNTPLPLLAHSKIACIPTQQATHPNKSNAKINVT